MFPIGDILPETASHFPGSRPDGPPSFIKFALGQGAALPRRHSRRPKPMPPTASIGHVRRRRACLVLSPEMRSISGEAKRSLDRLGHFAALEAAGANVSALRLAVQEHADALEIRVEAALRRHHRVAPVVPKARLLAADCADLRHRPGSVAERLAYPAAADRSCEKRSAISSAARTASAPFDTRASACSRVSHVSTPNETGIPVSNPASWRPLAASDAT